MARSLFPSVDEYSYTNPANSKDSPYMKTTQETIAEDTPGSYTQRHEVGADISSTGQNDSYEYADRHQDGSSARGARYQNADGTSTWRDAQMDKNGRVTSMSEETYDKDGGFLTGRYDKDGDGTIDQQSQQVNGSTETYTLGHGKGAADHFGWQAKGEWDIDADGNGTVDWRSNYDPHTYGDTHQVSFYDGERYVGVDVGTMSARGSDHMGSVDYDGNGYIDTSINQTFDREGHLTNQSAIETSNDAAGTIVDVKNDFDGDGWVDRHQSDVNDDGVLDDEVMNHDENPIQPTSAGDGYHPTVQAQPGAAQDSYDFWNSGDSEEPSDSFAGQDGFEPSQAVDAYDPWQGQDTGADYAADGETPSTQGNSSFDSDYQSSFAQDGDADTTDGWDFGSTDDSSTADWDGGSTDSSSTGSWDLSSTSTDSTGGWGFDSSSNWGSDPADAE
ncbi:hypothetical protein [Gloeobacter kilaueensis]|uniref:Uncharacterized protein n=1 Tax=Gloeobacter kilaueensis (strain ATCC BAA-2537 / CCAP 1431/1 / ULC 316 / JS1) TaxID=1183438 RepID=U5QMA2_GLOK1|nr:hypothetical protein [Gloeobacter kilaueensis]AGY60008.1 hypothetical protein GKIL_3762 [Gloeobacter kilaueensis JS1]